MAQDPRGQDLETKQTGTGGGASVGGSVHTGGGAFVGRDQITYQGLTVTQVAELMEKLKQQAAVQLWDGRIPYPGLQPFRISDAQFFFGREDLVDDLLERVQQSNFLVIAGPSGSGKSSLARAGLLYALHEGRLADSGQWPQATMTPGAQPLNRLAAAVGEALLNPEVEEKLRARPTLLPTYMRYALKQDPRRRFVLLVDQFEEIFTQTEREAVRASFIDLLATTAQAAQSRALILLTLRSDFVGQCAQYPTLRDLLSRQFRLVGAMSPRDLARAIARPALAVGAEITPALVAQVVNDMKGQPGALPLMSFALRDLFEAEMTEKGQPLDLTLPEYLSRGGIESALERHANRVFDRFSEEEKELARALFSRLIAVSAGGRATRRAATLAELVPPGEDPAAVRGVVNALAREQVRLLVAGRAEAGDAEEASLAATATLDTSVTIAHERLIEAWPWLQRLVDEKEGVIKLLSQVERDAEEWDKAPAGDDDERENKEGLLYQRTRLARVEEEWDELQGLVGGVALRFVEASRALREAEQQRERERVAELERINRDLARQVRVANARALATQANEWVRQDFKESLLLACRAVAETVGQGEPVVREAYHALYRTLLTARAHSIALGHRDAVYSAVFSTDGTRVVTAGRDGTARLWEGESGTLLATLAGHTGRVESASFSPDGARVVTAGRDRMARVWDTESGLLLATLTGHKGWIKSARFSPDGTRVVTASEDRTARLWDGVSEVLLATLPGHIDSVMSAAFSPNGARVVTASQDSTARLWDGESGALLATLAGHTEPVESATFSPDGLRVVTASRDRTARLWAGDNGAQLATLEGHTASVWSAAFSPDGLRVITASEDRTARLWDWASGALLATLAGHTGPITAAAFSPDGARVVTASGFYGDRKDNTARLWDGDSGALLATLVGHTESVWSAAFSPGGTRVVTASEDGTARVWGEESKALLTTLRGHRRGVNSAAFSPDGKRVVTASKDGTARLWAAQDGALLGTLEGHTSGVNSAAFSPDGARVVTASGLFGDSNDNTGRLWDGESGTLLATLEGHTRVVNMAAFSPDGTRVVTASEDRTARLWDGESGNLLVALEGHRSGVGSAGFSPDGIRLVTASWDGTVRIWDGESGALLTTLVGHTDPVWSAAFSPDGARVVTASRDGTGRLWDGESGALLATLAGHTEPVESAAFSPDGLRVVTASRDRTARLWDGESGALLATLAGHSGPVKSAAFSADSLRVVTTGGSSGDATDKTARLWDGESGAPLATLEGHRSVLNSAAFSPDGAQVVTAGADGIAILWVVGIEEILAEAKRQLRPMLTPEECKEFFPELCLAPESG